LTGVRRNILSPRMLLLSVSVIYCKFLHFVRGSSFFSSFRTASHFSTGQAGLAWWLSPFQFFSPRLSELGRWPAPGDSPSSSFFFVNEYRVSGALFCQCAARPGSDGFVVITLFHRPFQLSVLFGARALFSRLLMSDRFTPCVRFPAHFPFSFK